MAQTQDTSVTLAMPKAVVERLDRLAEQTQRSRGGVIRFAVQKLLDERAANEMPAA
jgi:predicted transcriptional regulator